MKYHRSWSLFITWGFENHHPPPLLIPLFHGQEMRPAQMLLFYSPGTELQCIREITMDCSPLWILNFLSQRKKKQQLEQPSLFYITHRGGESPVFSTDNKRSKVQCCTSPSGAILHAKDTLAEGEKQAVCFDLPLA